MEKKKVKKWRKKMIKLGRPLRVELPEMAVNPVQVKTIAVLKK